MYTGVMPDDKDPAKQVQVQCLAFGDGQEYEKYAGNPVLSSKDLPAGLSPYDFRDPKIFRRADGTFGCVVCACTQERDARILLFVSENGTDWHSKSILAENNHRFGSIWECPDFFQLDGRAVLLCSPMDMAKTATYSGGKGTLCLIGSYDEETGRLISETDQPVDYGIDFYAPQSTVTPDGRRVLIAWMQTPETMRRTPPRAKWFGQLTIPRELTEKDGLLIQKPIREIEAYRKDPVYYENVYVKECTRLTGIEGRSLDLAVRVKPAGGGLYKKFTIKVAEDEEFYTSITYDPADSMLYFDRTYSGFMHYIISERKAHVRDRGGEILLRLMIDRFSVEIFVNDGEQVMSNTIYTRQSADGISFETAGGAAVIDVEKYTIEM
jgi:beta-fructofuranosidase